MKVTRIGTVLLLVILLLSSFACGGGGGPEATITEEEAEMAVFEHLSEIATSSYGLQVLAAYQDASWYGGPSPVNNELTPEGWYIYHYKYADDIDQEPLLGGLFEHMTAGSPFYGACWLVKPDGEVAAVSGNALRLEAELQRD